MFMNVCTSFIPKYQSLDFNKQKYIILNQHFVKINIILSNIN